MAGPDSDGELSRSVEELTDEVRVLRESVDELREVVEHFTRQIPHDFWQVLRDRRIDSMSRDPASPDFQTNTVPAEEIGAARAEASASNTQPRPTGKPSQRVFAELDGDD